MKSIPFYLAILTLENCLHASSGFNSPVQSLKTSIGNTNTIEKRRSFITTTIGSAIMLGLPKPSLAKQSSAVSPIEEVKMIREASETLAVLLENWEKATVECIFADVPRELLESKNKEQLLEKAKTSALFDKSASVVSCKKTNKVVRDYIGVTGKGPLVNVSKRMLKRQVVEEYVDIDDLDRYYSEVETFEVAIASAASSSYTAGTADFDSMNNFEKGNQNDGDDSNLEQSRKAIVEASESINRILSILSKESNV